MLEKFPANCARAKQGTVPPPPERPTIVTYYHSHVSSGGGHKSVNMQSARLSAVTCRPVPNVRLYGISVLLFCCYRRNPLLGKNVIVRSGSENKICIVPSHWLPNIYSVQPACDLGRAITFLCRHAVSVHQQQ